MSELELSLFRQRSHEALKQKARRGAFFLHVAAGYLKAGRDRIEKDPDQRVQDALKLVFAKFSEFQSARQAHVWLRDEGIVLPVKSRNTEERGIIWRLPAYNTVHNILTNPIYAAHLCGWSLTGQHDARPNAGPVEAAPGEQARTLAVPVPRRALSRAPRPARAAAEDAASTRAAGRGPVHARGL